MVNNSIIINKTNNHLLTELTEYKKTTTCDVGNQYSVLGQVQTYGGVKPVNEIPNLPI